ncbi:CHM4C protein, partial [Neodrepanis coruscans]|nr:CHM4C protein [Neodrepanis coruscans]
MSKISKFFKGGGSAASKGRGGPSPQEALARLRETEEMLSKKQEYLETRIERELAVARQHGTKNKRGECGPDPTALRWPCEVLNPRTGAPPGTGICSEGGTRVSPRLDLNKIDDLMQDITEQQDVAQEISDAISNRATFGDEFDE